MQYSRIRYTECLVEPEAVASVGSKSDSYDHAMAEALNSLSKAECIRNPVMRPKGLFVLRRIDAPAPPQVGQTGQLVPAREWMHARPVLLSRLRPGAAIPSRMQNANHTGETTRHNGSDLRTSLRVRVETLLDPGTDARIDGHRFLATAPDMPPWSTG